MEAVAWPISRIAATLAAKSGPIEPAPSLTAAHVRPLEQASVQVQARDRKDTSCEVLALQGSSQETTPAPLQFTTNVCTCWLKADSGRLHELTAPKKALVGQTQNCWTKQPPLSHWLHSRHQPSKMWYETQSRHASVQSKRWCRPNCQRCQRYLPGTPRLHAV